ncbi:MAG: hypothetical protein E7057_04660 [Lentisphaerae bacterium]|nr:hypothetical protein [Lentisphaerota bacterium]
MLAKFIRMRTARSAATASHPCVERATEVIKKKNPAGVTPLSFLCLFSFAKESRVIRFSFAYFSFFVKRKVGQRSVIYRHFCG